jgi:two-component system OmpR family response regulator
MKLLLLEDDDITRAIVIRQLTQAGHTLDACATGTNAIFLGTHGEYGVLILDRLVPEIDGLSALKALRAVGVSTPALLLTAMAGIADRVEGLEAGADDYLVKPFAATELIARVNALLRRPPIADRSTKIYIKDLTIDRVQRTVTRAGKPIKLKPLEYKLLDYLIHHSGEVVTRAMLLENVWSSDLLPKTNIIDSHMSRLRAKVDRGFDQALIHTVYGSGYRINT